MVARATPDPAEPPKASLADVSDDELLERLKKLPGFTGAPPAAPAEPATATSSRAEPQASGTSLHDTIRNALREHDDQRAIKAELARLTAAPPTPAAPASEPEPPSWREKIWGKK